MMQRRLVFLCVAGALAGLGLAGCGGDDTAPVTGGNTATGASDDAGAAASDASDTDAVVAAEDGGAADGAGGDAGPTGSEDDASAGVDDVEEGPCPGGCDDGDPCTKDACGPDGSCVHTWSATDGCLPLLEVTSPQRAAVLEQAATITVSGTASSPTGTAHTFTINGLEQPLPDGDFSVEIPAHEGVHVIEVVFEDAVSVARTTRGVVMAEAWLDSAVDDVTDAPQVEDGMRVFLGADFFDDGDPSDLDDLASIAALALDGVDVVSLLPDALTADDEGADLAWCEWTIDVSAIAYEVAEVTLSPASGGLSLGATLTDVSVTFEAIAPDTGCPDAGGTVDAASAAVTAFVGIALTEDGVFEVTAYKEDITVTIDDLEFELTEGVTAVFEFLLDWFDGTVAGWMAGAVESALAEQLTPTLADMLAGAADWSRAVALPALLGEGDGVMLTARVTPETLALDDDGLTLGLAMGVAALPGEDPTQAAGAWLREGCFDGDRVALEVPAAPIAMALRDDVVNAALFAAWWGGAMHLDVPSELLASAASGLPVSELQLSIEPQLAPIVTDCVGDGALAMQIADLRVDAAFLFNGMPAEVIAWASADVIMAMEVAATDGAEAAVALDFGVTEVRSLAVEIAEASGAVEGASSALDQMVTGMLDEVLLEGLGDGVFQRFPVPSFDVSGEIPGVPEGTSLTFAPSALERTPGATVLTGGVDEQE